MFSLKSIVGYLLFFLLPFSLWLWGRRVVYVCWVFVYVQFYFTVSTFISFWYREHIRDVSCHDCCRFNRLQQWMYAHCTYAFLSPFLFHTNKYPTVCYYFQSESGELAQKQFYQQLLNHSFNEKAENINKRTEKNPPIWNSYTYIRSIVSFFSFLFLSLSLPLSSVRVSPSFYTLILILDLLKICFMM